MTFNPEWEEPIPQPEPPKRKCLLGVREVVPESCPSTWNIIRGATIADLAKALGVPVADLEALSHAGSLERYYQLRRLQVKMLESTDQQNGPNW